ncbi:hypothetical protein GCM10009733_032550 [Nonomuraea maheshkhaliensis]|uniref:Integrase catalytic domain-containing protein n=1 Tax=Nonomuraea maheshkhaliensis TaxID=419590 RepID=A0ABP4R6W1_9ACTN
MPARTGRNEQHLRHALREYEHFYNQHRAHQALNQAAPLRPAPDPIADSERITDLDIRRRDRLGGVLHEYSHAAQPARMQFSAGALLVAFQRAPRRDLHRPAVPS